MHQMLSTIAWRFHEGCWRIFSIWISICVWCAVTLEVDETVQRQNKIWHISNIKILRFPHDWFIYWSIQLNLSCQFVQRFPCSATRWFTCGHIDLDIQRHIIFSQTGFLKPCTHQLSLIIRASRIIRCHAVPLWQLENAAPKPPSSQNVSIERTTNCGVGMSAELCHLRFARGSPCSLLSVERKPGHCDLLIKRQQIVDEKAIPTQLQFGETGVTTTEQKRRSIN